MNIGTEGFFMKNRTDTQNSQILKLACSSLLAAAVGLILSLLFALVLSVLIANGIFSEGAAKLGYLTAIPGAFLAGLLTAKSAGKHMLPFGLMGGAVFFLLLILLSVLFLPSSAFSGNIWATLGCCAGGAVAGAFLAPRR